jgi:hypothetical protein
LGFDIWLFGFVSDFEIRISSFSARQRRGLPGCFSDAWYLAFEGKFAETDTAEAESSVICACTAAPETAIVSSSLIFGFFLLFIYQRQCCHLSPLLFSLKRHAQSFQQCQGISIFFCGSYDSDIHAEHLLYLIVFDFWKYRLL